MFWKRFGSSFLVLSFLGVSFGFVGERQALAKKKDVMKFVMSTYIPPQAYKDLEGLLFAFPNYVKKHGKDMVHLDYYHSGTLLKGKQALPGLMQGTADIILQTSSYISSTFPILGILELPFLFKNSKDVLKKTGVGSPLYKLINKELAKKNVYMISNFGVAPEYIWTKDRPIKKPEDLKGLRIRAAGRIEAKVIKALGAASTSMPSAEIYEALSRGTIDGVMSYIGTIYARGLQEEVKYVNKNYFASYGGPILIRLDMWKSLPPDVKKLFLKAGESYQKQMIEFTEPYWKKYILPALKKAGLKETKLSKKEKRVFINKVKPVWGWWKKQLPPGVGEKAIKYATE